jgi:hypothetical protein
MSDLESFNPVESSEGAWNSSPEVSEKFKEAVKKATAGIQRTQKDEKKGKHYDLMLSAFLVQIILNKDFDSLLAPIFDLLDQWHPSNFILGVLSLVYHPIHIKVREISKKPEFHLHYKAKDERMYFHDYLVDAEIKKRINVWIEDVIDVIVIDPSSLLTARFQELLAQDEKIVFFFASVFQFFFQSLNIDITLEKSKSYGQFVVSEIKKSLENLELEEI